MWPLPIAKITWYVRIQSTERRRRNKNFKSRIRMLEPNHRSSIFVRCLLRCFILSFDGDAEETNLRLATSIPTSEPIEWPTKLNWSIDTIYYIDKTTASEPRSHYDDRLITASMYRFEASLAERWHHPRSVGWCAHLHSRACHYYPYLANRESTNRIRIWTSSLLDIEVHSQRETTNKTKRNSNITRHWKCSTK